MAAVTQLFDGQPQGVPEYAVIHLGAMEGLFAPEAWELFDVGSGGTGRMGSGLAIQAGLLVHGMNTALGSYSPFDTTISTPALLDSVSKYA